jgi:hypothetical protein
MGLYFMRFHFQSHPNVDLKDRKTASGTHTARPLARASAVTPLSLDHPTCPVYHSTDLHFRAPGM